MLKEMARNLAYALNDVMQFRLPEGNYGVWLDLYKKQHQLLKYEKGLDRTMASIVRQEMNSVRTLPEIDRCFSEAFADGIDRLGGIQRFLDVREELFSLYDYISAESGGIGLIGIKIGHFRTLSKYKRRLYEQARIECIEVE
jgi:hypothetical protein